MKGNGPGPHTGWQSGVRLDCVFSADISDSKANTHCLKWHCSPGIYLTFCLMYKAESTLNPCLINIYSLPLPPLISSICRHSQGTQRQLVHGERQGWGREREKYILFNQIPFHFFWLLSFFWTHNEKGKSLVINIQRSLDQTQVCLILIRNVSKGMVFQRESQTPNRKTWECPEIVSSCVCLFWTDYDHWANHVFWICNVYCVTFTYSYINGTHYMASVLLG